MEQQDVALLALELYRNGHQQYLLVPRVLPIVQGARRSLELTVIVKDSRRAELDATVVTKEGPNEGPEGDEDSFFAAKFADNVADDLRAVVQRLRAAGIPGLTEDHMRSGQPTFAVQGQNILTISPGGQVVDHIQPATAKLEEGTPLGEALTKYRSRLGAIPGATQRLSSGRVVLPASAARQHVEAIVAALREFGQSPAAKA